MVADQQPVALDVLIDDLWCIAKGKPACRPIKDVCADAVRLLGNATYQGKRTYGWFADDLAQQGTQKDTDD
jgi:hypothetical protein